MRYFPIFVDLHGRSCVVVGGGTIAQRKVETLLEAGARVTVISPQLTAELGALAETHEIVHHARQYRHGDLAGATLAFAATDDEVLHAAIAADAVEAGILLNVVDRPPLCGFIMPAVATRGAVSVAISTGGASPALARWIKHEIEAQLGDEYALAAEILGKLRSAEHATERDQAARARMFTELAGAPLLDALRDRDAARVDAILTANVGPETTLARLGVSLARTSRPDGTPAA